MFSNIVGFDVSKYQYPIDFVKMRQYGAQFLILRASYGMKRDERFDDYIAPALEQFSRVGIYHFYEPLASPQAQADTLLRTIEAHKDKITRVWLDLEFWWSGQYQAPQHWKTLRDLIAANGYKIGWYTRATWWNPAVGSYAETFGRDALWAAQYNSALTLIPNGWTKAMIWQSGTPAIGYEAGVSTKEIDYNLWNDDFDFEAEWYSVPQPPSGGTMEKWNLLVDLNLRNAPNVGGTLLMTMPKGGSVWGGIDAATGWINVKYLLRPGAQYAEEIQQPAYCSGSASYVAKQTYSEPPLPQPTTTRQVTITISEPGWKPVTTTVTQEKA